MKFSREEILRVFERLGEESLGDFSYMLQYFGLSFCHFFFLGLNVQVFHSINNQKKKKSFYFYFFILFLWIDFLLDPVILNCLTRVIVVVIMRCLVFFFWFCSLCYFPTL